MTEITVDIDQDLMCEAIPIWAYNYLTRHEILFTLKVLPKQMRFSVVQAWSQNEEFSKNINLSKALKVLRVNESGNVVFFWSCEAEMTMFFVKWS